MDSCSVAADFGDEKTVIRIFPHAGKVELMDFSKKILLVYVKTSPTCLLSNSPFYVSAA